MMPYKKRYTLLMRLQDSFSLLLQAILLAILIITGIVVYKKPDTTATLNAAVDSCQARGYFDVGTVRVQCQVGE